MQALCIVIPCFNEEARFPLNEFLAFYESPFHQYVRLLFVNDGSSDNTEQVLDRFAQNRADRIKILSLPHNQGKAEAVRQGILQALGWQTFDYIGYFDADLATPLTEIDWFLTMAGGEFTQGVLLGSRLKRLGADVQRSTLRHVLGRIFATVASTMLAIPVYDSQCGAKLVRRDICESIFHEPFISPWLFDLEILVRVRALLGSIAPTAFLEVPLRVWTEKGGSRLKFSHILFFPFELIKIYFYKNR